MVRGLALLLTVFTGFTALVYEVAWQRALASLLGSHSEATAAVLGVFLGGLALGYALFGSLTRRVVERARDSGRPPRLLALYGAVEAAIGLWAFGFMLLLAGVQGITDLITTPGLINLDFADVKSVMQGAGSALMGIGSSRGADRAIKAAELAVASPLLEASIDGAHGVLLSIQGGSNLGIFEINDAAKLVQEAVHYRSKQRGAALGALDGRGGRPVGLPSLPEAPTESRN